MARNSNGTRGDIILERVVGDRNVMKHVRRQRRDIAVIYYRGKRKSKGVRLFLECPYLTQCQQWYRNRVLRYSRATATNYQYVTSRLHDVFYNEVYCQLKKEATSVKTQSGGRSSRTCLSLIHKITAWKCFAKISLQSRPVVNSLAETDCLVLSS